MLQGQLNEFRQQISNLDSALDVEALKRKAEEDEEVSEKDDDEGRKRRKTMETLVRCAPSPRGRARQRVRAKD